MDICGWARTARSGHTPRSRLSPALQFAVAGQVVELSPEDAGRLGIVGGEEVEVAQNGTRLRGRALVRTGVAERYRVPGCRNRQGLGQRLTEPMVEVSKA